ncbi:hypothetical protein, partial [Klebsiella pneumoniae]|uniref:hypothetical protein n=1 Tax=Klebsiella pneumoniae TaxID=573 RepID=UPI001C704F4C
GVQASENTSVGFITMNPHFIFGITATVRKYESVCHSRRFLWVLNLAQSRLLNQLAKKIKEGVSLRKTSQSIPD